MQAKCKRTFIIAPYSKVKDATWYDYATYYVDKWYDYYIEEHEEAGTLLYYVNDQPMLEKRFKEHFIDIQEIRDTKIDQILKVEV